MHHEIGISWPNGKNESRNVDFIHYGNVEGPSAMAQTVGYTTAIAAKMVLESIYTVFVIFILYRSKKKLYYFSEEIQTLGINNFI